jgi:2-hydroxychromene-2-carboxylate isomerase
MTLKADWFVSFRSPYTYLAQARVHALTQQYELEIALRPVFPLAVRDPDFFKRTNPLFAPYLLKDTMRVAQMEGIPYAWPRPDPVVMDLATLTIDAAQPYIRRISYLGVEAQRRGRGVPFFHEAELAIWDGSVDGWHEGDHLAKAAERAGLDLADMEAAIAGNEADYEAEIEANQAALTKAGHWGVPTLVFEGEPFFGQDRIALFVWRLEQHGLKARA